jgi:hypothetical protein
MPRTLQPIFSFWIVFLLGATPSLAGVISPIVADTDMTTGIPSSFIGSTIDQSGLSGVPGNGSFPTHANADPSNAWLSTDGILTGSIYFTLGGVTDIQSIWLWNMNSGDTDNLPVDPPPTRSPGSTGLNEVEIWYANDSLALDALSASYTKLGTVNFTQVTTPTSPVEIVSVSTIDSQLSHIEANYIKFMVISNHGDATQTGFSEVAFEEYNTSVVPEPSSLAICAAFTAIGFCRRVRQRSKKV